MPNALELPQEPADTPTPEGNMPVDWLQQGEKLHEQGVINLAEVKAGSPDSAAIRAGHGLTTEGRRALSPDLLREPTEDEQQKAA